MKLRSIIEIFLCITVPFATSGVFSAFSDGNDVRFATPQCNHNQLAPAVGEMTKCETKIWHDYVEKMLRNYKDDANGGKASDPQGNCRKTILLVIGNECLVEFSKSCLPNYIEKFFSEIYDASKLEFNCTTSDYNLTTPTPDLPQSKPTKLQEAFNNLNKSCEKDKDCPQNLLAFDKQCTIEKKQQELAKAFIPCLQPLFQLYSDIFSYIIGPSSRKVPLDRITPCETIRKVLDECFVENECFSQREMTMVRNILATVYHRGMGTLILVDNELGSLTEYVVWAKLLDHDLFDHIVEDYKSGTCKNNQEIFERMTNDLENSGRQVEVLKWTLPVSLMLSLFHRF